MGLSSHWKERKASIGRTGSKRPIWWLILLLGLVLFLMYKLGNMEQVPFTIALLKLRRTKSDGNAGNIHIRR